jgi:hypothetical protein
MKLPVLAHFGYALTPVYRNMQPMMFDDPAPMFDDVMTRLESLERLINGG